MTEAIAIRLWNPHQAHAAIATQLWPTIKAMLMAGHRLERACKPEKRSSAQNRRLWAMLTDISRQVEWHGQKLSPEDWKHIFSASLKKQRAVPGLDGGFVVLGLSTSKMTRAEMCDMQELMSAFGAERGVVFSEHIDQETGEIHE